MANVGLGMAVLGTVMIFVSYFSTAASGLLIPGAVVGTVGVFLMLFGASGKSNKK